MLIVGPDPNDPIEYPKLEDTRNENHRSPVWNNAFSFTTEGKPIHHSPAPSNASTPGGLTRNETVGATAMSRMSMSSSSSSRPGTPSGLLRNGSMGATAFSRMALSSFSGGLPGVSIAEGEGRGSRPSSRSSSRRNSVRDGAKASTGKTSTRRANKENET